MLAIIAPQFLKVLYKLTPQEAKLLHGDFSSLELADLSQN
jgi:hypothetical protein